MLVLTTSSSPRCGRTRAEEERDALLQAAPLRLHDWGRAVRGAWGRRGPRDQGRARACRIHLILFWMPSDPPPSGPAPVRMADWVDALAADGGLAEEVWRGIDDGGDADDGLVRRRGPRRRRDADADLAEAVWRASSTVDGARRRPRRGGAAAGVRGRRRRVATGVRNEGAPPGSTTRSAPRGTRQRRYQTRRRVPPPGVAGALPRRRGGRRRGGPDAGGGSACTPCQRPWCRASPRRANDCERVFQQGNVARAPWDTSKLSADKKGGEPRLQQMRRPRAVSEGKRFAAASAPPTRRSRSRRYGPGRTYELYHQWK